MMAFRLATPGLRAVAVVVVGVAEKENALAVREEGCGNEGMVARSGVVKAARESNDASEG